MVEASRLKKKQKMAEGDLLSKLPVDLLVKILLCIPTKEAIATMILSKQWRSIWRNLPCLYFKIFDENCNNLGLILDQLDEEPFLETLSIKICLRKLKRPADFDMEKYVEKAINRKVANLTLYLDCSADPIRLPKTLYTSKTLVKLSLSDEILLENLSSESSLPCLKTLKLCSVRYKDEETIVSFLSSCPVLEVLDVDRCHGVDNVKNFMVKVSSLREFLYFDYLGDAEEGDRDLVIDTPLLKRFKFQSWGSTAFCNIQTKTKMTLDDAYIDILEGTRFPDDNFLESMASVITLQMFLTETMIPCCTTVKFSRLTECKINPNHSDWLKPLMSLLANSPKLKKLSIEAEPEYQTDYRPVSWKEPSCVPECLWSHLEVFELKQYGGSKVEKKFITYILGNSNCLKLVKVSVLSRSKRRMKRIMEDLKDIFRVSTTSHLAIDHIRHRSYS